MFDTYAVSFIKAKHKIFINKEDIKEAWEHWFHKVIDYFYIKTLYPEKILVPFEDIHENTEYLAKMTADYLNIDFDNTMLTATIFGNKVKVILRKKIKIVLVSFIKVIKLFQLI